MIKAELPDNGRSILDDLSIDEYLEKKKANRSESREYGKYKYEIVFSSIMPAFNDFMMLLNQVRLKSMSVGRLRAKGTNSISGTQYDELMVLIDILEHNGHVLHGLILRNIKKYENQKRKLSEEDNHANK